MRTILTLLVAGWGLGPLAAVAEPLSVLLWNVQRGANLFANGPEKALKVIRDSKANLVLMQESYDIDGERPELGVWLAAQLGWRAHQGSSPHLCILTKFEIVKTFKHEAWHGIGAHIRTPQGDLLAWSCWIDHRAYLPDYLTENPRASLAELLACETTDSDRAKQTAALLARLKRLGHLDSPLPLLVGGDWNSPSHLDYGPDTRHLHRGHVIPLPSSLAFEQAGFTDTFRQVHPSALKKPGMTWTPIGRTNPKTRQPVALDRIDRLYLRGGLRPVTATTLPNPLEKDTIRKADRAFPSDHCAVLTTFAEWEGRQ
jgi:endonuclease/exonuclease/phosphatase family metal-dependent hydrolase